MLHLRQPRPCPYLRPLDIYNPLDEDAPARGTSYINRVDTNIPWRRLEIDNAVLNAILKPWYESLKDPVEAQMAVLRRLVSMYGSTGYGEEHSAHEVEGFEDLRRNFPKLDYPSLEARLADVRRGDYRAMLPEPPEIWVMTRGSTGRAKVLPATRTHLEQIYTCGARALVNHVVRTGDLDLARGRMLNLSFPSRTATLESGGSARSYGYSSGAYSRLFPSFGDAALVPTQEEIDALGPGIARADWERRFELVYAEALDENVTAVIGVAPVILSFARFLRRRHGRLPRDLWGVRAIFPTSVRKIPFRYGPKLRRYFGDVPVVEIYSATEGVFAQQRDDLPYVTPNYDAYLFEVEAGGGTKMLHELGRGEWGRLIVSTCMLPRYDMGDMIEAMGENHFRVFGRAKALHVLEHRLYRLLFGRLL